MEHSQDSRDVRPGRELLYAGGPSASGRELERAQRELHALQAELAHFQDRAAEADELRELLQTSESERAALRQQYLSLGEKMALVLEQEEDRDARLQTLEGRSHSAKRSLEKAQEEAAEWRAKAQEEEA